MKVSIITVVLNNKETVNDAILSIGFQDDNDIEHIITEGIVPRFRIEPIKVA